MLGMLKKLISKILGIDDGGVCYVGGGETLPTPLTPPEESRALGEMRQGSAAAKSLLIERNLRLVVYIARKFDNTGVDVEDLISVGTIGLIKAVNSYNFEKNIKLATYASRCAENEILMHLRRIVRTRCEVSLDEPLNVDFEGNELLISDILGTEPDIVCRDLGTHVEKQLLRDAVAGLTDRERVIMEMRFGHKGEEEKTQKEVADILGISQSYISRLEKKIILHLRKELNKSGIFS